MSFPWTFGMWTFGMDFWGMVDVNKSLDIQLNCQNNLSG